MRQIIKFVLIDIFRNKIVIAYALLMALLAWTVFNIEDTPNKAVLTLLNFVLLVVPLMSVLFSTIYIYNSAEFIELLLSQPVRRSQIWISLFIGLSLSLVLAFLLAMGIPLLLFAEINTAINLIVTGSLISVVFVSIAFFSAIFSRDKAKGVGVAILVWLYLALLFDGLVLFLMFQFAEYPIEKPMVLLTASSPLDLARIINLLQLDSSVMLGYTGAIFKEYFGSGSGVALSLGLLSLWAITPFYLSLRKFRKKDL